MYSIPNNLFYEELPDKTKKNYFPKLEKLELAHNKIFQIPDNVFDPLENLKSLALYDNKIVNISNKAFSLLHKLENLYLGNNKICTIAENAFDSLESLKNLELQGNKIAHISSKIFNLLLSLETLDLSENGISKIDDNAFDSLSSLSFINLQKNKLKNSLLNAKFTSLEILKQLIKQENEDN